MNGLRPGGRFTAAASPAPRPSLVVLVLVVGVSVGLVAAACGDGGKDTPASPVGPPPPAAEDKARAGRVVLTEDDLPGLTTDAADQDDAATDPSDDAFETCADGNPVLTPSAEDPRGAKSYLSADDKTVIVSSRVNLAETEEQAKAVFAQLNRKTFQRCVERAFTDGFGGGGGFEGSGGDQPVLSVARLSVGLGDESVHYRSTLDSEIEGFSITLIFDFVVVRVGRGLAGLNTFEVGKPYDTAERIRLTKLLAERLQVA